MGRAVRERKEEVEEGSGVVITGVDMLESLTGLLTATVWRLFLKLKRAKVPDLQIHLDHKKAARICAIGVHHHSFSTLSFIEHRGARCTRGEKQLLRTRERDILEEYQSFEGKGASGQGRGDESMNRLAF